MGEAFTRHSLRPRHFMGREIEASLGRPAPRERRGLPSPS